MAKKNNNQKLVQNSHYLLMSEMFNDAQLHTTMERLLDVLADLEYRANVDSLLLADLMIHPNTIHISARDLTKIGINKNQVTSTLRQLEKTGLVNCNWKENGRLENCVVNRNLFYSMMVCFRDLDDAEKANFTKSLKAGKVINDYSLAPLSDDQIKELKVATPFLPFRKQQNNKCPESGTFEGKMSSNQDIIDANVLNPGHNGQKCPEIGTFGTIMSLNRDILGVNVLKSGHSDEEEIAFILDIIKKMSPNQDISDVIYEMCPEFWLEHVQDCSVDDFLTNPLVILEEYPGIKMSLFGTFCTKICPDFGTFPYIYKIKRNEGKERSSALVKKEKEKNKIEIFKEEEIFKGEGKGEEGEGDKSPVDEIKIIDLPSFDVHAKFKDEIERRRKRERLRKFSKDQIEEIFSDFTSCYDRSDKIFIHLFWKYMMEDFEDDWNEEEEERDFSEFNPEGILVHIDKIECWLKDAITDTLSLIENKRLTPDEPELPITASEFNPKDVYLIIDWEEKRNFDDGTTSMRISKTKFNDIYAEELPEVKTPKGRSKSSSNSQGRIEDLQYCQKINLCGDTEEDQDKLTPMEQFIYQFEDRYLELDDALYPTREKKTDLNYKEIDWMKLQLRKLNIPYEDFFSVLVRDIQQTATVIPVSIRMFSADKIRRWNQANNFTSIIDDVKLEEFFSEQPTTSDNDTE